MNVHATSSQSVLDFVARGETREVSFSAADVRVRPSVLLTSSCFFAQLQVFSLLRSRKLDLVLSLISSSSACMYHPFDRLFFELSPAHSGLHETNLFLLFSLLPFNPPLGPNRSPCGEVCSFYFNLFKGGVASSLFIKRPRTLNPKKVSVGCHSFISAFLFTIPS